MASGAASPGSSALDALRNAVPPARVAARRSAAADGPRRKRRSERTTSAEPSGVPSWKRASGARVKVHSRPSAAADHVRARPGEGVPSGWRCTSVSCTSAATVRSERPGAPVGSPSAGSVASAMVRSPP